MKQRLSRKQNYMSDTSSHTGIAISTTSDDNDIMPQRRFFPRRFIRKYFTIKNLFLALILFVFLSFVGSNIQFYMRQSWVRLLIGKPNCHKEYVPENQPPAALHWTKNLTLDNIVREYISKEPYFKNKPKYFWKRYRSFCWGSEKDNYCLPSVYLAGWPKSATTAIYTKLRHHNQIYGPRKETYFWNFLLFTDGKMTFEEYAKSFSDCSKQNFVVGIDATPLTIVQNLHLSKRVPARIPSLSKEAKSAFANYEIIPPHIIVQITPKAKFILLIREPGSRTYSHYLHEYRRVKYEVDTALKQGDHDDHPTPDEFHQLVVKQINSFNDCVKKTSSAHQCVYDEKTVQEDYDSWLSLHMGLYAKFIKDVVKLVPWDSLLIIRYEDYMKDPSKYLGKVLEFMDVLCDDDFVTRINRDVYLQGFQEETVEMARLKDWQRAKLKEKDRISDVTRHPMLAKTRQLLTAFYEPYNKELSVLLNDDRYLFRDVL